MDIDRPASVKGVDNKGGGSGDVSDPSRHKYTSQRVAIPTPFPFLLSDLIFPPLAACINPNFFPMHTKGLDNERSCSVERAKCVTFSRLVE